MAYQNNDYKYVAVLNSKVEIEKLMNALGHMTAGLSSLCNHAEQRFLQYIDASETLHPAISFYPFIILKSKNGNQIRTLRNAAIDAGIKYNDFVDTMLGSSAEDQLQNTKNTEEPNLEYFGICLFGKAEELNKITKKFSLF
jgi:hypothetical protein